MSDHSQLIALPARIHAFLADGIERHGCGGGRDPRRVVEALPQSLPTGRVERLVSVGRSAGSSILALMIDGRVALEGLENDRMSGSDHDQSGALLLDASSAPSKGARRCAR
jgi:hypothetical protein